jgi:hypothetical protein
MRFKRCLLIIPLNMPRISTRISQKLCRPTGFAVRKIGLRRLTPPAEMCRPLGCFIAQHLSGTQHFPTHLIDASCDRHPGLRQIAITLKEPGKLRRGIGASTGVAFPVDRFHLERRKEWLSWQGHAKTGR